jgi:uncharacterized repeat protein (TIGR01451 family)
MVRSRDRGWLAACFLGPRARVVSRVRVDGAPSVDTASTSACATRAVVAACLVLMPLALRGAATITIVNADPPGVGFNDPTPVAPVGGNAGTTLGQQRLIAFQAAANQWGVTLSSPVAIRVRAVWTALTCTATSAVLGSAGVTEVWRDFINAPVGNHWYGKALANALSGRDQDSTTADISANFNVNLGNPGCLTGIHFYLGLDNNHGGNVDLITVLIHELAHGLGFLTFTSGQTGAQFNGSPSIWDDFLLDNTTNKTWTLMTNAERAASAVNTGHLVWNGGNVTSAIPQVLQPQGSSFAGADATGRGLLYAPGRYQSGSSVSHWDTSMFRNQLMEPAINADLTHAVTPPLDLTFPLLKDIGWSAVTIPLPAFAIVKTHSGNFTQGQLGATYTISVTNNAPGTTSGTVTVTDTLPVGLTATAMAGPGWGCTQPSGPCTRSDALAPGAGYPAITVTVNVARNAPASVMNTATVSGGGALSAGTASDVAVIGSGSPPPAGTDLALGQSATQSSTLPGYPTAGAASAVDGNTNGNFFNGSVTHTNLEANPWWQVDLGTSATINSIAVWNRVDCCGTRLGDYWVFVSNTPFGPGDTPSTLQGRAGTFGSHQAAAPNPFTTIAAGGAQGRYVRVQLTGTDYLSLAEVQVFGTGGLVASNLALGKPVAQSSTLPGYATAGPAGAVDGNTDGNFFDGSVTHTNLENNPWWQVDLGASATVNSIAIWNRTDCCGSRLGDYWVFVSDTPFLATDTPATLQGRAGTFSSHQATAPNPSATIAAGAQGRYVRVQLAGSGYLSLAEVQVIGTGAPAASNVALGKQASQSSTLPGYASSVAGAAVDGNTDGNFFDGSVTHTNLEANPWWQVDLGASAAIGSLAIWNRTDACCVSRLSDYWVFISDTPFGPADAPATLQNRAGTWSSHQTTAPTPSTTITAGAQGRYVRVQLTGTNYLSLAEVQVLGQ